MIYVFLTMILLFLSLARGIFASGDVFINEVAWMGTLPKEGESTQAAANNEWIELYNPTSVLVSLDGWKIVAEDGVPDISLSGSIGASGFFLLERTDDDTVFGITADQIYTGALEDIGERLFLKNSSGAVVYEIDASFGWLAGNKETKETMQKINGAWVSATSTPRATNVGGAVVVENSSSPPPGNQQPPGSSGNAVITPQIGAYAGEDREVAVGSFVYFLGHATGLDGKPLENARFWWNFGDGGTKEGRSVSYIYQFPGNYTVGLHVSSGSYSASDYIMVKVVPNQLAVEGVLQGERGYVRFKNDLAVKIDIGGWSVVDGQGVRFVIPPKTQVGEHSSITFPNELTGLLKSGPSYIEVFYPSDTRVAFKWNSENRVGKIGDVLDIIPVKSVKSEVKSEVPLPTPPAQIVQAQENTLKKEIMENSQHEVAQVSSAAASSNLFFILALILALASAAGFIVTKKYFF